jgi:hypothetical protein
MMAYRTPFSAIHHIQRTSLSIDYTNLFNLQRFPAFLLMPAAPIMIIPWNGSLSARFIPLQLSLFFKKLG